MKKKRKNDHWLNNEFWRLALGEWIALTLTILTLAFLFGIFLVRRHVIAYRLGHTFAVSDPEFFGSALALGNPVAIEGNAIDLLQNGDAFFPAMLDALRAARKTINFEAYILRSDAIGRQFRDVFCERARVGVEVRISLDGIGSGWGLDNSDVALMKQAGCKFRYYHPTHSWRLDRTNRRSHRRVLVIDGELAFTGGVGFTEQWSGHAQDEKHWRDVQLRVRGPLVTQLQAAFEEHWAKTAGEALSGKDQFPLVAPAGKLKAQVVASHSFALAPVPLVQAVSFAAAPNAFGSRTVIARPRTIRLSNSPKPCGAAWTCASFCPVSTTISRSRNRPGAARTANCSRAA